MGCMKDWQKIFDLTIEHAKIIMNMKEKEKALSAISAVTEEQLEENGITSLSLIQEIDMDKTKSFEPHLIVKMCSADSLRIRGWEKIEEFIKNMEE
jgi:hypothetical protein